MLIRFHLNFNYLQKSVYISVIEYFCVCAFFSFAIAIDLWDQKPYLDTQGNIIQFVIGNRGTQQLNINNQLFSKMSLHADVTYWRYISFVFMVFSSSINSYFPTNPVLLRW